MLPPNVRALYTECLEPPDGYRFDQGVATTFTLDLETLLVLPFTLATQRAEDPSLLLGDPRALLHAIRETSDKLVVFHHAGAAKIPKKENILFSLLDECVVPALPSAKDGVFHPKLWLLRFVSEADERPLLRAVVLSRNLTYSRAWDTVLSLEGEVSRKRVKDSYGLRDLVSALPALARIPLTEEQTDILTRLAADAERTRFEPPPQFREPVRFHAIGVEVKRRGRTVRTRFEPDVAGTPKHVLCVSPFLTPGAIDRAGSFINWDASDSTCTLISRAAELDRVGREAVEGWDCHAVLESVQVGETADDLDSEDETGFQPPPRGLHAKMLCVEDYQSRVNWWIGSANLTGPAWEGKSVDLMVELSSTVKHAGIDRFLESGFGKLLEEWLPSEEPAELDADEEALTRVDETREELLAAGLGLACAGADDAWELSLQHVPALPHGVTGHAWPISLREAVHAQPLECSPAWAGLATPMLTSFIAFELRAKVGAGHGTRRFVMQLPHDPFPEDRHAHIVQEIVRSRAGFFRLLRLLLAEATGALGMLGLEQVTRGASEGHTASGAQGQDALFEEMVLEDLLRTLSRSPVRLKAVDRLVADLEGTEQGMALIPSAFLELWTTIREVWRRA